MTDAREEFEDSAERLKDRPAAAAVVVGKDRPGEYSGGGGDSGEISRSGPQMRRQRQ